MVQGYSDTKIPEYFKIRANDSSAFYAISDRIDINDLSNYYAKFNNIIAGSNTTNITDLNCKFTLFRGDCYICQFTERIFRNFNSPSAPYNDIIVDPTCWRKNYKILESHKWKDINLGDVNAVKEGMWVTFTVRSSNNLNVRSLDQSFITEAAESGHPRGFFPYHGMFTDGSYKLQEANIQNKGFSPQLSDRYNFEVPDVPHIKNWFGTRIMYSDTQVNDAFQNGFRVFRGTNYRDYTRQYGEITKILNYGEDLLVIFEHGIGLISVNERSVAASSASGHAYINTSNVLPEHPRIISETYGSQWPDSIIITPADGDIPVSVFGVDTVAKKIWQISGGNIKCISDFKVSEFLNNNITLGERENTPIIGVRNVKTCYNAYKKDVMFTFYDNLIGFEEKVWNLCYNMQADMFTTFYSWVPSYMDNIDNIPFSFNRDVSKWISKLGISHAENSFARGITLSNNIFENDGRSNKFMYIDTTYLDKNGKYQDIQIQVTNTDGLIGILNITPDILPKGQDIETFCTFQLDRDIFGNYRHFEIRKCREFTYPRNAKYAGMKMPVYGLYFKSVEDKLYIEDTNGGVTDSKAPEGTDNLYIGQLSLGEDAKEAYSFGKDEYDTYFSEIYYRNKLGHEYSDWDDNKVTMEEIDEEHCTVPITETVQVVPLIESNMRPNGEIYKYKDSLGNKYTYAVKKYVRETESESIYTDGVVNYVWGIGKEQQADKTTKYIIYETQKIIENKKLTRANYFKTITELGLPPFKNRRGQKECLDPNRLAELEIPTSPVFLLNIKANIFAYYQAERNLAQTMEYLKQSSNDSADNVLDFETQVGNDGNWISVGTYDSQVAVAPKWNLQFLNADFWKHGQAGLIDIADDIYPTTWYGETHPFEFEFLVVDDPSVFKAFKNIQIVANKAQPESFHYEIIGDSYDFAQDKPNMYFRQEARKALFQYNESDIIYNRNFLKINPRQLAKSAELIYQFYERQDDFNHIYDSYIGKARQSDIYHKTDDYHYNTNYESWVGDPTLKDYRHLSGAELVWYENRNEFRIWQHQPAINLDLLSQDSPSSIYRGNCQYLEGTWYVKIKPLLIAYKNEYMRQYINMPLCIPEHSTWATGLDGQKLPPITILNTSLPKNIKDKGSYVVPEPKTLSGKDNALYGLYNWDDPKSIDLTDWLSDPSIYKTDFGASQNRLEADLRDKFVKIRIRYSGKELAIIDFVNTIYQLSYA